MGELARAPEEQIHYATTYVLKEMIARGFTTVRDTGKFQPILSLIRTLSES